MDLNQIYSLNVLDHNCNSIIAGFEFYFPWISMTLKKHYFYFYSSNSILAYFQKLYACLLIYISGLYQGTILLKFTWLTDLWSICTIAFLSFFIYLLSRIPYEPFMLLILDSFFPYTHAKITGGLSKEFNSDIIVMDQFFCMITFFGLIWFLIYWFPSFAFFFDNTTRFECMFFLVGIS